MAVRIENIKFENYRQYGTRTLTFSASGEHLLSVIIAKNGTGKTTLLNAITWCLYGKELLASDALEALPLINTTIKHQSASNSVQAVSATLSVLDDSQRLEFKRTKLFQIREGLEPLAGKESFSVSITDVNEFKNTKVFTGNDASAVVTQYFDQAIYKYYFFDGERLQDFFSAENSTSIRDAIFNISQVTLLETTDKHLKKMYDTIIKDIGKQAPDIDRYNDKVDEAEQILKQLEETLQNLKKQLTKSNTELESIDNEMQSQKPIQELHKERKSLEEEDADVDQEMDKLHSKRCDFIQNYMILLKLYPRIKRTLTYIAEKEESGDLPPSIDREEVERVLKNPDKPCPFCDNPIDVKALNHLKELLRKIAISSRTSHTLKEYKGSLEECIEEVKKYEILKRELTESAASLEDRKRKITKRLEEISSNIAGLDSDNILKHMAELEDKRAKLKEEISTTTRSIGSMEQQIFQKQIDLKKFKEDRDKAVQVSTKFLNEQKKIDVIHMLRNRYQAVKDQIITQTREEISEVTWSFFDDMIWKKNTFGSISISDSYDVSVYDKSGSIMTGSLSATEQMALAYAFTLAIHSASGRNCPIVIDSPLGRVSDVNREKMAAALLEVSKQKQIIMLFTPDEYSENVKKIYSNHANISELRLNEDETFIVGVGES